MESNSLGHPTCPSSGPRIVTASIEDNRDFMRVLLYSYHTTMTLRGPPNMSHGFKQVPSVRAIQRLIQDPYDLSFVHFHELQRLS